MTVTMSSVTIGPYVPPPVNYYMAVDLNESWQTYLFGIPQQGVTFSKSATGQTLAMSGSSTNANAFNVFMYDASFNGRILEREISTPGGFTYTTAIDTDADGNIYIFRITNNYDYVVVKLNPSGNIVWQSSLSTEYFNSSYSVTLKVSGSGSPYLITTGTNDAGGLTIYVIKLNTNGSLAWAKMYEGGGVYGDYFTVSGATLAEANSELYVTGNYNLVTAEFTVTTYSAVTKLSTADGSHIFTKYLTFAGFDAYLGGDITTYNNGANTIMTALASNTSTNETVLMYGSMQQNGNMSWWRRVTVSGASEVFNSQRPSRIGIDSSNNSFIGISDSVTGNGYLISSNSSGSVSYLKQLQGTGIADVYVDANNRVSIVAEDTTYAKPLLIRVPNNGTGNGTFTAELGVDNANVVCTYNTTTNITQATQSFSANSMTPTEVSTSLLTVNNATTLLTSSAFTGTAFGSSRYIITV